MDLKTIKVKSQQFKAFGEEEQGFDSILPINLIVGKNNTGKSALIDTINHCITPKDFAVVGRDNKTPLFFVTYPIEDSVINRVFPTHTGGGGISGNHNEYGKKWAGKHITCRVDNEQNHYEKIEKNDLGEEMHTMFNQQLNSTIKNPLRDYIFRRLLADRDITPEPGNDSCQVQPGGKGATAVVQRIYSLASENPSLIEKDLLNALNDIFSPDFQFIRIFPRDLGGGHHEIFLEEEKKGLIGLSSSGSGLKTVLLVLINTVVLPKREKQPLSKYIFAFEELENNLHPGTQRRLFSFLRELAEKEETHFFITTHSSVAIDMFSGDDLAQIIHVTNDGQDGKAEIVQGYSQYGNIIDDLDVRASDLLQSNSIIWVEGPSDRIYINKWIELISGDELKEGRHYQCVFYGGKLLARLQASQSEQKADEEVNILSVNRHSILVMDRDKDDAETPVNDTKQRMMKEVEETTGLSWLTAGREIENYIPQSVISRKYSSKKLADLGQFEKYKDYLEKIEKGLGDNFADNKNVYASEIVDDLTLDDLENVYDLKEKVTEVCNKICDWNNIPHINQ